MKRLLGIFILVVQAGFGQAPPPSPEKITSVASVPQEFGIQCGNPAPIANAGICGAIKGLVALNNAQVDAIFIQNHISLYSEAGVKIFDSEKTPPR